MDSDSDEEHSDLNPFIIPDSQVPEEQRDKVEPEQSTTPSGARIDSHVSVLAELEISKLPETPTHLQGSDEDGPSKQSQDASVHEQTSDIQNKTTSAAEPSDFEEDYSEVIPIKDEPVKAKFLNTSCDSVSSVVSTISYKTHMSSEEAANANRAEFVPQRTKESDKDLSTFSCSTGQSVELNHVASDVSEISTNSSEALQSSRSPLPSFDLSRISSLYQRSFTSSGEKSTSSTSSLRPLTSASSHLSQDTPSVPSSPEFRIPGKAPLHKVHSTSSSGESSFEDAKGPPRKKKKLDVIKEHHSLGPVSSSASFQEDSSHEPGSQSGLSSREVTHLETPPLRSTPNEPSFECLQLSGEARRPVASVYSLPDPLPSSPSVLLSQRNETTPSHFSELEASLTGEEGTQNVPKKVTAEAKAYKKSYASQIALPKWVKDDIERKKIEFESSSDSAHLSASSSPATSPPFGKVTSSPSTQSSMFNLSSMASSSDVGIQCVLEDFAPPEARLSQGRSVGSASGEAGSNSGDQKAGLAIREKVFAIKKGGRYGSHSKEKAAHMSTSEGISSTKIREEDVPMSQDYDMEIEMSQDLFNPLLTGSNTGTVSAGTGDKKPAPASQLSFRETPEDLTGEQDQDLSLFLSQTQHEAASKESYTQDSLQGDQSEVASGEPGPSGIWKLDKAEPEATQKQSIAAVNPEGSASSKQAQKDSSNVPKDIMKIPKEIFEKVIHGSTESSPSNLFHLSLPPEGEQFHPNKTLTPPLREVELQGVVIQEPSSVAENRKPPEGGERTASKTAETESCTRKGDSIKETGKWSDVTKLSGLPQQQSSVPSSLELGEHSETLYAKAMRISKNIKKREANQAKEQSDSDPFAFPESEDVPPSKRRKLNLAKDRPSSALPEGQKSEPKEGQKSGSIEDQKSEPAPEDSETFCRAVVQVTTEEEIVRTVKRRIVTHFYSLETDELLKTKTSEFVQTEAPEKTLNVRSSTPTVEIVSFRSISLDSSEGEKGTKTPSRKGKCTPMRTSPRYKRRSSSSTSLEGAPGVPKAFPSKTSTPSTRKQKSKKQESGKTTNASKKSAALPRASAASNPLGVEEKEDADKSEYEKLLEIALAEERVEKRETRSSVRSSAQRKNSAESIRVGAKGFGKWLDGCYYPGTIMEKSRSNRYKVEFHDGRQLVLAGNALVLVEALPVGQRVFAHDKQEDCYVIGTISAAKRELDEVSYEIKFAHNESSKLFKSTEVMLDAKQVNELRIQLGRGSTRPGSSKNSGESSKACEAPTNTADSERNFCRGNDNTASSRQGVMYRQRAGSRMAKKPDTKSDRTKTWRNRNRFRRLKEKREKQLNSIMVKSSTSPDEAEYSKLRLEKRKLEANQKNFTAVVQPKKMTRDPTKRNEDRLKRIERLKQKQKEPGFVRLYGRLPEDPVLFQGLCFLITYVAPKKEEVDPDVAHSCEGFQRSYLGCQIVAGGGTVLDSVNQLDDIPKQKVILIAPTSQKTLKYYFALSFGVPCLSHSWIKECCEKNCLVDQRNHRLEAGINQLTGTVVDPHKRTQPLRGIKIFLQALQEDKEELSLAVRFAGAQIVNKLPKRVLCESEAPPCNYILVGDNAVIKRPVHARSRMFNIPCVSIKWFYQCLILGELIDPLENTLFLVT